MFVGIGRRQRVVGSRLPKGRRRPGRQREFPNRCGDKLGIHSGDAVVIDGGEESTVAKMWPADPSVLYTAIQVDGDTR